MATPLATAYVRIRPDTKMFGSDLKKEIDRSGRGSAEAGRKHGRIFGASYVKASAGPLRGIGGVLTSSVAGLAGGLAAVAGVKVFAGFIADARESNKIARITAQAIKSTGGAANVSAKQVGDLATAISNKTGKDDEAIQSGQNLLLTFTNIRNETGKGNDIFNQASRAIVDMTAALNNGEVSSSGLKASSIQLGKALNDPIKGVTALRKVGVSFTEQQTKQIKKLVESGKTLDAQKIILKELGKEFGGAAAASTDPLEKLRVIVGNLGERIGNVLLPALTVAATIIANKVIPAVGKFIDPLERRATPIIAAVAQFVSRDLIPAVKALAGFIATSVVPAIKQWFGIIAEALQPALNALGEVWKQNIRPALKGLFDAVQRNWPAFKRLATIILLVAGFLLKYLLPPILRVAGVLIQIFFKNIARTIDILGTLIKWLIIAGKAVGTFAVATARYFTQWYKAARDAVLTVIEFFRRLPGRIRDAVGNLGKLLYNAGRRVITGFWNGVKAVWSNVIDWFKGLPSRILSALGIHSPPKWSIEAGRHIMAGILKGIVPGGQDLLTFGKNIVAGFNTLFAEPTTGATRTFARGTIALGQQLAAQLHGWTGNQWRALYDLWNNESGWNPLAKNPTSSAFGIPQFLAGTARQYGVYGNTNPAAQIAAGMKYIQDVYGTPANAWAAWLSRSPHWYDKGGWLMPGATLAINKTGKPERVLGPRESYGNTYNINIAVPPNANQHDIGRQVVESIKAYERGSGKGWRS